MKKVKEFFSNKRNLMYLAGFVLVLTAFIVLVINSISHVTDSTGRTIIHLNRVAFTIFEGAKLERHIYFYALFIISGIGLAYFYAYIMTKRIGFNENDLFDGFLIGVIVAIIGARLYYAAFAWDTFKDDPLKIITGFVNEEGGLAIHGAVFAVAIFVFLYWKKRRFDLYKLGEMLAPGFLIGQTIGRWGNFFNKEAHGGAISNVVSEGRAFLDKLPIPKFIVDQMYIDGNYMHPTFLYESVWNLLGLAIVLIVRRFWKKYWTGDAILFYLVWYGIGRYFVEALRTDYLPFRIFGMELRIAQVVSVIMIITGIALLVLRRVFKVHPVSFIDVVEEQKLKLAAEKVQTDKR